MTTRRAIRGVLGNFLGTYTSRYSDYQGYWLFGFLIRDLGELRINLLSPLQSDSNPAFAVAAQVALVKFQDQARKAGLVSEQISDAWLSIRALPGLVEGSINGQVDSPFPAPRPPRFRFCGVG